jgi:hypothetical protein
VLGKIGSPLIRVPFEFHPLCIHNYVHNKVAGYRHSS